MLDRFMARVMAVVCVGGAVMAPSALGQCGVRSWVRGAMPALDGHGIVYDSLRQRVMSFGGSNAQGQFSSDTWSFDGTSWVLLVTANSPPPTQEPRNLAYDSVRDRVVKYGGFGQQTNFETWEFDGTNWSRRSLLGPLLQSGMVMEYDPARQKTVLFGGFNLSNDFSNQTWLWNGSSWTRAFPAHSPPARVEHGMTYDTARQKIVLYGGRAPTGGYTNDLWEWDGTDWTERTVTGPTVPVYGGMAYDTLRHYTHLCGSSDGGITQNWMYDGTTWTAMTLPPNPECEMGGATQRMIYMAGVDKMLTTFPLPSGFGQGSYRYLFGALTAPTVAEHPCDQIVPVHGIIEVNAAFTCTPGTTYRWYFNDNPLSDSFSSVQGATSTNLVIFGSSVTGARTGDYTCTATSPCGATTTNAAHVEVTCQPRTVDFEVDPSPASFTVSTPVGPYKIDVLLLGRVRMLLDPACAVPGTPRTQGSITSMDLHTEPAIVQVPGIFGGSVTISNPRLVLGPGDPGMAGSLLRISPWTDRFMQSGNEPALSGIADYDTFGETGSTNLADLDAGEVDWTVQFTARNPYTLSIPFTSQWVIDADQGNDNPTLTMVTTLHGHAVTCTPDIGQQGGIAGADGALDNNDFIVYINYFFGFDTRADLGSQGGVPGADGAFDNNDFIVYIDQFFTGCM